MGVKDTYSIVKTVGANYNEHLYSYKKKYIHGSSALAGRIRDTSNETAG